MNVQTSKTNISKILLRRRLDTEFSKRSFWYFVKHAFKHVQLNQEFKDDVYIKTICDFCEDVYYNRINRGFCNIPPATGKSTIISILFPVWVWIKDPSMKIISISYSPQISYQFAQKSLELIKSKWFQDRFKINIKSPNQTAQGHYQTDQGGYRLSTSPGSKLTGLHADLILIDDPNKAGDSKNQHEAVIEWFKQTLPTRLRDQTQGRIVLIQQRLAHYDASSYCLSQGWASLILPMEFDPGRKDPRDHRTIPGEPLSQRFPKEVIKELSLALGIYAHAQLQQNPTDELDAIFKVEHLNNTYDILPKKLLYVISVDLATYAKESSDYSAVIIAGKDSLTGMYYIIQDYLFKKDFSEQVQQLTQIYEEYKAYNPKVIVENKANGPALVNILTKHIPVKEYNPGTKSKLERANSISYLLNTQKVLFSKRLSKEAREQLLTFPRGKNDDAVDALTQALAHLSGSPLGVWEILKQKSLTK